MKLQPFLAHTYCCLHDGSHGGMRQWPGLCLLYLSLDSPSASLTPGLGVSAVSSMTKDFYRTPTPPRIETTRTDMGLLIPSSWAPAHA